MYNTLYDAWQKEKESEELQNLPPDFYSKAVKYIHRIRQEGRMLDQKSTKARLVSQELRKARHMIEELAKLRFSKLVRPVSLAKPLDKKVLAVEEESIFFGLKLSSERFQAFLRDALRGKAVKIDASAEQSKRVLLRFTGEVPAVVGVDLKVYGPFSSEDVALLPLENARVLMKRGVAMEIETK